MWRCGSDSSAELRITAFIRTAISVLTATWSFGAGSQSVSEGTWFGQAPRQGAMRCATLVAVVAIGFVVFPLPSWGTVSIQIPKKGDPTYDVTQNDTSQAAPAGYEGRTDISTETAVGKTPATTGKRIVATFKLGNQIKTCPAADGTAEGTGVFSMTVDYTDKQANGTSTIHIEMLADAKYKGKVGDDANLINPVNAEIDYTYNQTGSFRDPSGAIATSPPSHVVQHITIPVIVAKGMNPPDLGPFSGGDPIQGHYAEAMGLGMALSYWGGIYYSVAELKWLQGECVKVAFNPPSNTRQPPLGTQTTVKVEVKTKAGESVKANILVRPRLGGGTVDPGGGTSDVGSPMKFTYTAPNQKAKNAGFGAYATSRAGVAEGVWDTGLGTDWSGQISYVLNDHSESPETDMGGFSTRELMQFTITVKEGVATATNHAEKEARSISRQKALRGGAITLIKIRSETYDGLADGTCKAQVQVAVDQNRQTYSISPNWAGAAGKLHQVICFKEDCHTNDTPYYAGPTLYTGIEGKLEDPNHLSGSRTDVTPVRSWGKGERTWTVTWDLARQGSAQ